MHAIADGRDGHAARITVALAALTTCVLLVGIPLAGVLGGTLATLVAESVVAGLLLVRLVSGCRVGNRVRPSDRERRQWISG
ncbi:MAG: hypothetical protein H0V92_07155 [Pseudonocardiales bacterium]|nr:hypothetical protein [Pseudonocardiales bacterium]